MFTGDPTKPESYPYFGADIHAVADGPVVAVVDGLPEQVPGKTPDRTAARRSTRGNHIVQDLGDGNYALYAHLKTGSVKVKVGRSSSPPGRSSPRSATPATPMPRTCTST